VSGIGFLGGLGKRLLQAAAQRVVAAGEAIESRVETKQLPPGIAPDRLDAALQRLRSEHPPAGPPGPYSESSSGDAEQS
jgi:hypothetical protein